MNQTSNLAALSSDDKREVGHLFKHWFAQFLGHLPPELFHYTNSHGLCGIVQGQKMRLTNIAYLNDETEYRRAVDRFAEAIDEFLSTGRDPAQEPLWRTLRARIKDQVDQDHPPPPLTFVGCFSSSGDRLSQWRGYAGSSGFSIGFKTDRLAHLVIGRKTLLLPCVYDDKTLKMFVDNILGHLGRMFTHGVARHSIDADAYAALLAEEYIDNLEWYLPVFKDPGFSEEEECRLITRIGTAELDRIVLLPKQNILSGYIEVDLSDPDAEGQTMPLSKLVVGPGPHMHLSRYAASVLLHQKGYSGDPLQMIDLSSIPFREIR